MAHAVGGFLLTVARQWMTNEYNVILHVSTCSKYIILMYFSLLLSSHVPLSSTHSIHSTTAEGTDFSKMPHSRWFDELHFTNSL